MINLNYRDSQPIYEQIKSGLRGLIIAGVLKENERLPTVRAMATELAINPNTIQRAYHELENEGYVYSIVGKGSFVAETKNILQERKDRLFTQFDSVKSMMRYIPPNGTAGFARSLVSG